jgi:hypothetical protein
MITKTLRQYFSKTAQELDDNRDLFNLVESLIDNYCGVKLNDTIYGKAYSPNGESAKTFTDFTISGNELTLTDETFDKNTFQFCVVEPLEGDFTGLIPVISSDDNVLTLAIDSQPDFTACEIYQLGTFPRYADFNNGYKKIPEDIRQACFLLSQYLLNNQSVLDSITFQSENQSTSSYSYSLASGGNANLTMPVYISNLLNKFKY